ncbi:MAG: PHP domain-containing protein [Bacillota bacterium]
MKLDLHTHSKYSDDSFVEPADIVRLARERGMDGVAVTDHLSLRGGLEARSANRDPVFLVIPGIEYPTDVGHVVGLFVETEPSVIPSREGPPGSPIYFAKEVVSAIHAAGGVAVLAHPFESRIRLPEGMFAAIGLDALEGFNGRAGSVRNPQANFQALEYARANGIPVIGGSDAHFQWEVARAGCAFEGIPPGASPDAVRRAILRGEAVPFGIPAPRTTIPMTSLSKIRKSRRFEKVPRALLRLALTALGPTGLWLENLARGPLEE